MLMLDNSLNLKDFHLLFVGYSIQFRPDCQKLEKIGKIKTIVTCNP